jgi:uncharacterized protein (TIGR04255 family)
MRVKLPHLEQRKLRLGIMARLPKIRPKFRNPPLAEQAVTISFDPIQGFDLCDFGLFWGRIRDEFPVTETAPPIETATERFDDSVMVETGFSFSPIMLPRAFYRSNLGDLVQLQHDRLTFNWVKTDGRSYPHFEQTLDSFKGLFERLEAHILDRGLAKPNLKQAEVTNLNIIDIQDFNNGFADIHEIFRVDPLNMEADFLVNETYTRTRQHRIVAPDGQAIGRLHTVINPVINPFEGKKAYKFELTVRSTPNLSCFEDVECFFEDARSAINAAFLATVQPSMKKKWE